MSRNLPVNGVSPQGQPASPRALMREAALMAARYGLSLKPVQIRRLVSGYLDHGNHDSIESYFLDYLDPTGERAVNNTMRRAG